jgi:hypothetical protein
LCLVVGLFVGCPLAVDPEQPVTLEFDHTESLEGLVSRTLERNLRGRTLSTETQGAWQIFHGVLAYGSDFVVQTPTGGEGALDYLLGGGKIQGFEASLGDWYGDPRRRGIRVEMDPSTKVGQGHRDQWLAIVSQCGLPLETELRVGEQTFELRDWLWQAEYDLPRNLELEFSWTLIPLTIYRGTDYRWIARDGVEYSIEDLVDSELRQSLPTSVCGGTHRLIGLAMTLNKRRAEGKPMTGVWQQAEDLINESIDSARRNQNPDGSFSVAYLHRPGWTRDLGETLGTTGHVLEFLAFAASDETLNEPWVERSVRRLCQVLEQCEGTDVECGVLYHALHGLGEYQSRIRSDQKI